MRKGSAFWWPGVCLLVLFTSILTAGCGDEEKEHRVKLEVEPEEAGSVSGEGFYPEGKEVAAEAESRKGYRFSSWVKDGEEVSHEKSYTWEADGDRKLVASFVREEEKEDPVSGDPDKQEEKSVEAGEVRVTERVLGKNHLEPIDTRGPLEKMQEFLKQHQIWMGDRYLAFSYRDKFIFLKKEGLEKIGTVGRPSDELFRLQGFFLEDYFFFVEGQFARGYHLSPEGAEKVCSFDLSEKSWDLERAEGGPANHEEFPEKFTPGNFFASRIDDYALFSVDYSSLIGQFEEPPRLEEPFLKLFRVEEDGLEEVEHHLLEEPLLTTDAAYYGENRAVLATGDEGFMLLDLEDYSARSLQAGGKRARGQITEDYPPEHVSHRIYGVSSRGAIISCTSVPVPKCHSRNINLWSPGPDFDPLEVTVAAEEHNNRFQREEDENLLGAAPRAVLVEPENFKLVGDWWPAYHHPSEGEGFKALLTLDQEKAGEDAGEKKERLSPYFCKEADLEKLLEKTPFRELPEIIQWQGGEENKIAWSNQYHVEGRPVLGRLVDDHLEITRLVGDIKIAGVDAEREEIYLLEEEKLCRLDYDSFF